MKTQEEYAHEIDEIVRRDVESCQSDWFKIDKEIFMQPKNKNKIFILGTRKTGCDLIILGGTNCDEGSMDWLFGSLGNENFYVCQPQCGAQMLLPRGADQCPECYGYDTLVWVDEDRQEMDTKHLDCLAPMRKLELQEYLSQDVLAIEHSEYYKQLIGEDEWCEEEI